MSSFTVLGYKSRVRALISLSGVIREKIQSRELAPVLLEAYQANPWFTEGFVINALQEWSDALLKTEEWLEPYNLMDSVSPKTVGVVNAGNIPFVGLHDMLSVLVSGHQYQGKNATGDNILLPYIAQLLIDIEPGFESSIRFVDRLINVNAVIATGNNNSARYFEYYFGKYPHIIRKNRNGIGVLTGNETTDELKSLGKDIFQYFGLGCRNISKLYVPAEYDFKTFFESIYSYSFVNESSKYMNNFEYNNSVFLLKRIPFLQNGFLILREEKHIASSISVVHFEYYGSHNNVIEKLLMEKDHIQCIAMGKSFYERYNELKNITVDFGETQSPQLWDYADGVDTLKFLKGLK